MRRRKALAGAESSEKSKLLRRRRLRGRRPFARCGMGLRGERARCFGRLAGLRGARRRFARLSWRRFLRREVLRVERRFSIFGRETLRDLSLAVELARELSFLRESRSSARSS